MVYRRLKGEGVIFLRCFLFTSFNKQCFSMSALLLFGNSRFKWRFGPFHTGLSKHRYGHVEFVTQKMWNADVNSVRNYSNLRSR